MGNEIKDIDIADAYALLAFIGKRHQLRGQHWIDRRDELMCLLMLDAGLRVGEVVQLAVTDLVFDHSPVNELEARAVITKTKRARSIPLTAEIKQSILLMTEKDWALYDRGELRYAFFVTSSTRHITTRQVQRMLKSSSQICLGKTVTPHMLRHTFATRLMRKTDIRTVQALLGHKSLTSTQIYTHPNDLDKRTAIENMKRPAC